LTFLHHRLDVFVDLDLGQTLVTVLALTAFLMLIFDEPVHSIEEFGVGAVHSVEFRLCTSYVHQAITVSLGKKVPDLLCVKLSVTSVDTVFDFSGWN
jgi:hypothetical protein